MLGFDVAFEEGMWPWEPRQNWLRGYPFEFGDFLVFLVHKMEFVDTN